MRSAALVRCEYTPRNRGRHRNPHRQPINIPRMMRQLMVPLIVLVAYLAGAAMIVMAFGVLCLWLLSFLV